MAGFSQGGALALYTGLTCPVQLGEYHEYKELSQKPLLVRGRHLTLLVSPGLLGVHPLSPGLHRDQDKLRHPGAPVSRSRGWKGQSLQLSGMIRDGENSMYLQVPIASAQFCHDSLALVCKSVKLKKYPGHYKLSWQKQKKNCVSGLGHDTSSALQHDLQMFVSNLLCQDDWERFL